MRYLKLKNKVPRKYVIQQCIKILMNEHKISVDKASEMFNQDMEKKARLKMLKRVQREISKGARQ